jgi:hypothetical protein
LLDDCLYGGCPVPAMWCQVTASDRNGLDLAHCNAEIGAATYLRARFRPGAEQQDVPLAAAL